MERETARSLPSQRFFTGQFLVFNLSLCEENSDNHKWFSYCVIGLKVDVSTVE